MRNANIVKICKQFLFQNSTKLFILFIVHCAEFAESQRLSFICNIKEKKYIYIIIPLYYLYIPRVQDNAR